MLYYNLRMANSWEMDAELSVQDAFDSDVIGVTLETLRYREINCWISASTYTDINGELIGWGERKIYFPISQVTINSNNYQHQHSFFYLNALEFFILAIQCHA